MKVGNPKPSDDFRNVSILARGDILKAIVARAGERDLSLNKAAISLIEDALNGATVTSAAPTLVNLENVATDDIIDELVGRLQQVGELDATRARADAAEAKLLAVASAIGGVAQG